MLHENEPDPDWLKRLHWSGLLHEIGLTTAHTAYHKHSAYILQNADMPGFSKREQNDLANIVLGHRGDLAKMLPYVTEPQLWPAVVALRLAVLFYRRRIDLALPERLNLKSHPKGFSLTFDAGWLEDNPLTAQAIRQEVAQWKKAGFLLELQTS
jgi:exopolyphosphatase/guanosine-5'-triphosphate,3'-diphosphate pyrophosphatase